MLDKFGSQIRTFPPDWRFILSSLLSAAARFGLSTTNCVNGAVSAGGLAKTEPNPSNTTVVAAAGVLVTVTADEEPSEFFLSVIKAGQSAVAVTQPMVQAELVAVGITN